MKKLNIITATSFAISILILCLPFNSYSQLGGVENGQWRYLGGDAGHTRAAPQLDQINSSNFADLEVAWIWRGNNFSASEEYTFRSTPIFVDGILYTVVGQRRQLVAIEAVELKPCPYRIYYVYIGVYAGIYIEIDAHMYQNNINMYTNAYMFV